MSGWSLTRWPTDEKTAVRRVPSFCYLSFFSRFSFSFCSLTLLLHTARVGHTRAGCLYKEAKGRNWLLPFSCFHFQNEPNAEKSQVVLRQFGLFCFAILLEFLVTITAVKFTSIHLSKARRVVVIIICFWPSFIVDVRACATCLSCFHFPHLIEKDTISLRRLLDDDITRHTHTRLSFVRKK